MQRQARLSEFFLTKLARTPCSEIWSRTPPENWNLGRSWHFGFWRLEYVETNRRIPQGYHLVTACETQAFCHFAWNLNFIRHFWHCGNIYPDVHKLHTRDVLFTTLNRKSLFILSTSIIMIINPRVHLSESHFINQVLFTFCV